MNMRDIRTSSSLNTLTGANSRSLMGFSIFGGLKRRRGLKNFTFFHFSPDFVWHSGSKNRIAVVLVACIGLSGSPFGRMPNVMKRIKTPPAGGGRPRHIQ